MYKVGLVCLALTRIVGTAATSTTVPTGTSSDGPRDPVYVTLHPSCEAIVRQAKAMPKDHYAKYPTPRRTKPRAHTPADAGWLWPFDYGRGAHWGWLRPVSLRHIQALDAYVPWEAARDTANVTSTLVFYCELETSPAVAAFEPSAALAGLQDSALPLRSARSPYVVPIFDERRSGPFRLDSCATPTRIRRDKRPAALARCQLMAQTLRTRADILYSAFDLSQHNLCNNVNAQLPGSTFPAIRWFQDPKRAPANGWLERAAKLGPDPQRETLVSFLGRAHGGWYGSSEVRGWLQQSHGAWLSQLDETAAASTAEQPVAGMRPKPRHQNTALVNWGVGASQGYYWGALANSTFSLVLHGDHRWSYRLLEVVAVGTIPVILSDGVSLPFEHSVDWASMSIRLPEDDAHDFAGILAKLTEVSEARVREMRRRLLKLAADCLGTEASHVRCFVTSLQAAVSRERFGEGAGAVAAASLTAGGSQGGRCSRGTVS